jgi:glycine/D-amino acid oxidase-like deaminating enzyme/nitrite reductase/ring-hydroxylating ferredoxin subunit
MATDYLTRSPWMSTPVPEPALLAADARADVCVVGAGIAGLSTAYFLAKKGSSVLVIDDGPVGGGMTGRTTAHLMGWIDDTYLEIERKHGSEQAKLAARSHAAAIDAIEAVCEHEGIDCAFTRLDGYLILPPGGDPDHLVEEYRAALRAEVPGVAWEKRAPLEGIDTGFCIRFPRQGQFHPLLYLDGLTRAIERLGGRIARAHAAKVEGGDPPHVITSDGHRIDCASVVVATNTPISDRVAIHTKQAPYLTYVIALRVPRGSVKTALFWDLDDPYHYVRLTEPEGELLLVGGQDHKTGQADDAERRFAMLELWARERFPMAREVVHRWSGQVMETVDGLAFIGKDPGDRNVFVATGDSGMGMTHGTIAGILLADLVHGGKPEWTDLYDPSRMTRKATGKWMRENANVAKQYADWFSAGEVDSAAQIGLGQGAIVRHGIHRIAAYRDAAGELHQFSARCTHLGCSVRWNAADASWDCPCHGSRFNVHGEVLSGPARTALSPWEEDPGANPPASPQPGIGSPPPR